MIPRQSPLGDRAILFAERGASGQTGENTLEGFVLAQRLGATGIESDLRVTADGVAVLHRGPKAGGLRKRRIAESTRSELGTAVVSLDELYEHVGTNLAVLLHVADDNAVEAALHSATKCQALDSLWLGSAELEQLCAWRLRSELIKLVHVAPIASIDGGAERHAAELRASGIDAVSAPRPQWNGGRTALYHRFRRQCFGTEAVHERMATTLLHIGLDAVSSPYPDRLVDAMNDVSRPDAPEFRDE